MTTLISIKILLLIICMGSTCLTWGSDTMNRGAGIMSKIILSKNCSYVAGQDPYFAPKYPFPISASMRALLALRPCQREV